MLSIFSTSCAECFTSTNKRSMKESITVWMESVRYFDTELFILSRSEVEKRKDIEYVLTFRTTPLV